MYIGTYRDKETGMTVEATQLTDVDTCIQTVQWIEKYNGRGSAITSISHDASLPEAQLVNGVMIGGPDGKLLKALMSKQPYIVKQQNNNFYPVSVARFEEQYEFIELSPSIKLGA